MKAIRIDRNGGPEVLELADVPKPAPGPGEALVHQTACGVNYIDVYVRTGLYKSNLPVIDGREGAGVVEAVGEGVTQFKTGNRVYVGDNLTGAYAEFVLCTGAQVHPLPEKISFAQGAAIYIPYATAYRALFQRAKAVAAETVLVHGATG
ncbi:MAG: alcohol dehydrogenase catalytic domain-containing protein, partial [Candidatus Eremiobacteraeota bacterium]|nr:alcohol dehydrogenase catalytic domain-containing protein [Candidatus Eremiobacteraeota bacterium]